MEKLTAPLMWSAFPPPTTVGVWRTYKHAFSRRAEGCSSRVLLPLMQAATIACCGSGSCRLSLEAFSPPHLVISTFLQEKLFNQRVDRVTVDAALFIVAGDDQRRALASAFLDR